MINIKCITMNRRPWESYGKLWLPANYEIEAVVHTSAGAFEGTFYTSIPFADGDEAREVIRQIMREAVE